MQATISCGMFFITIIILIPVNMCQRPLKNDDLIRDTCCLNCSFAGTFLFCGLINETFNAIVDGAFPLLFVRYRILVRILLIGGGDVAKNASVMLL